MSSVLHEQFKLVDRYLLAHQIYWRPQPFEQQHLPWLQAQPELCDWLDTLSFEQLRAYKNAPIALLDNLIKWLPSLSVYQEICQFAAPYSQQRNADKQSSLLAQTYFNPRLASGISGRKWQQINALIAQLPLEPDQHWLEWCAGKGFLGRALAANNGARVTSLEWQPCLCHQGAMAAQKFGLDITFVEADALANSSKKYVAACDHAVALHACGELHLNLLRYCSESKPQSVSISPCCYHLISKDVYLPLSDVAKRSALCLHKENLKLPLQETVTAGNRVQELRDKEVIFRLGFDNLQRELGVSRGYLPLPSVQKSILTQGFDSFCAWASEQKNIRLPSQIATEKLLLQAKARYHLVEQIETVRTLFRRPLELWLVLDRALYLQQQGYNVKVVEFCPRALTPRNLLIQGILT